MDSLTPSIKAGLSPQQSLEDRLHMLSHYYHLYVSDLSKIDLFHPELYETQQVINLLGSAQAAANSFSALYKFGQSVGYIERNNAS